MNDPLAVSYELEAVSQLRDALAMSHAPRWQWLEQAMDLGFAVARSRAKRGLPASMRMGSSSPWERVSGADQSCLV
jgi:hypothetical protein